ELHLRLKGIHVLRRRTAMDPHDRGTRVWRELARGSIEVAVNLQTVKAAVAHFFRMHETPLHASTQQRIRQLPPLTTGDIHHPQIVRRQQTRVEIGDLRSIRRPLRAGTDTLFWSDKYPWIAAAYGHNADIERAVVVLDVGDLGAVRRPNGVALVRLCRRDLTRLTIPIQRRDPDVRPAAALRVKEEPISRGRDRRITEAPTVVIV